MKSLLAEIRDRGWAASVEPDDYQVLGPLDPQGIYDVVMIAASLFGVAGDAPVALTLLGLPPGLTAERVVSYGQHVRDAGMVATRRSGGRAPVT